jgi:hypothetical protein
MSDYLWPLPPPLPAASGGAVVILEALFVGLIENLFRFLSAFLLSST